MTIKTRRTVFITALLVLGIAAVILVAVQVRRHSAPEAARLLPNSEAIVYFDVKTVRRLTGFQGTNGPHDPDYQKVIDSTGFEPERDLDEVAVAVHSTANNETRLAYIFIGPVTYSHHRAHE